MQYSNISSFGGQAYPDHNINPAKKGKEWCMQYAKAAWSDFATGVPKGVFYNNQGDYEKYRAYARGAQPITQYQELMGIDQQDKQTWMAIDWTVRPIISTYRDRAIARMMKETYEIVATPVDALAKDETDEFYAKMKTKIMIREMLQQAGDQELANHPLIAAQKDEPVDIEELEMRMAMGEQFNRAKDAEIAVALAFFENRYNFWRKEIYEDLFDYGVAGYKEWLGTDNKPHFRRVDPNNVVISYSRTADFSDIVHAGEAVYVPIVELATFTNPDGTPVFTEEQLQEIAASVQGKYTNPSTVSRNFYDGIRGLDKFKVLVLDLEFFSYNRHVYKENVDESGNLKWRPMDYNRGGVSEKIIAKKYKVVYKCKWIVGTEYCYDYGLAQDMKRSNIPHRKWDTQLSYKFMAINFHEMKAQGYMERVIPILDQYQMTWYKIQNFRNRMVPSGWWIDLSALHSISMTKGGANMAPKDVLQMFFETGVLVGNSVNDDGTPKPNNWKPVIPISNNDAGELSILYQDLVQSIQELQQMTGYNQITEGNPNPKTLVPGYELANQSTQDALYPLAWAETNLTERLAYDMVRRTQQALKKGPVEGYAPALNSNMITFYRISPDMSLREYGIMLEKKSTEQERMWLLQQMQPDIQNGFLDTSDAVTLINTHNAKQAQMIWAFKVKRNKELQQQRQMEQIELNNQGAKEAAMIAQQSAAEQAQAAQQFELAKLQMELQAEIEKERLRLDYQYRMNTENNMTKMAISENDYEGRVGSAQVQGEAKKISQQIAAEAQRDAAKMRAQTGGSEKK